MKEEKEKFTDYNSTWNYILIGLWGLFVILSWALIGMKADNFSSVPMIILAIILSIGCGPFALLFLLYSLSN